ncbi:hypothetical protein FS837_003473 [Tulasnella sp. UAMH 9824]|nr:hypothetical protein FS837_003473 [Tulasnella sp. UAMH 9824]
MIIRSGTAFGALRKVRLPLGFGLTGKDGSKALGLGSLKPEDAVADYSKLGPDEMKTLDNWLKFFQTSASLDVKMEFAVISDAETLVLGCRDTIKSAL